MFSMSGTFFNVFFYAPAPLFYFNNTALTQHSINGYLATKVILVLS